MKAKSDARGNALKVGDRVAQAHLDSSRGTRHGFHRGTVTGFARTRAIVRFDGFSGEHRIGGECLTIIDPVDGRALRTWGDVWAERTSCTQERRTILDLEQITVDDYGRLRLESLTEGTNDE